MIYQFLAIVGALMIIWLMYRSIKGQPSLFTREKMNKSFTSMGMLALILIVFVGLLVLISKP